MRENIGDEKVKGEGDPDLAQASGQGQKVIIYVHDAFGKKEEVETLPKEEIEKVLDLIREHKEEILRKAWQEYCNDARLRVKVWLEQLEEDDTMDWDSLKKKISYETYFGGGDTISSAYILLYGIDQNILGNWNWDYCEDLLDEEECGKIRKMIEKGEVEDFEEGMKKLGIDFNDRFCEYVFIPAFEDEGDNWDEQVEDMFSED